jgi:class 3 adenylate cyclase
MEISEVRFARNGNLHLAYQRYGAGPDVVLVPPILSNVELCWEEETYRRARHHMGRHVRVLEFDKRGIGSSDPIDSAPTLAERMSDILAVMDAEDIQRASLVGVSEGGLMAQLFAAAHPERVDRIALINSLAGPAAFAEMKSYVQAGDSRRPVEAVLADFETIAATWGREPMHFVDLACPSRRDDEEFVRWIARFQRQTTSPAGFRRQLQSIVPLDAPDSLGSIRSPTLVMHVKGDRVVAPAAGRWLAAKIPGARFVEIVGEDHFAWCMSNWREMIDVWLEFITGSAPQASIERRFATVLFTDIADSTRICARLGDKEWRRTLDRHDEAAHLAARRHAGKVVKTTGDGMLVTFDMPSAALACAAELIRTMENAELSIRAGVHAGEIEIREDGDVAGVAVHFASRVMAAAPPGATWVSSTVRDLLMGSSHRLEERGEHSLKGIDGTWRPFELCEPARN